MSIEQDPWSDIEAANLLYGFTPNNILTKPDDDTFCYARTSRIGREQLFPICYSL
jgi:hypothetical protein